MARPKVHLEKRITTAVRIPEGLHARLKEVAEDRDVSVNLIVTKALTEYLDRLLTADEILATRPYWPHDAKSA